MKKPSAFNRGTFQLLDILVWLWLLMSAFFLVGWRSPIGTIIAGVSGILLLGASLWFYRSAGGTWMRLIIGLVFLFGIIWLAVRW